MIRRRVVNAGSSADICKSMFLATGITAYLDNGGTFETPRPCQTGGAADRLMPLRSDQFGPTRQAMKLGHFR